MCWVFPGIPHCLTLRYLIRYIRDPGTKSSRGLRHRSGSICRCSLRRVNDFVALRLNKEHKIPNLWWQRTFWSDSLRAILRYITSSTWCTSSLSHSRQSLPRSCSPRSRFLLLIRASSPQVRHGQVNARESSYGGLRGSRLPPGCNTDCSDLSQQATVPHVQANIKELVWRPR